MITPRTSVIAGVVAATPATFILISIVLLDCGMYGYRVMPDVLSVVDTMANYSEKPLYLFPVALFFFALAFMLRARGRGVRGIRTVITIVTFLLVVTFLVSIMLVNFPTRRARTPQASALSELRAFAVMSLVYLDRTGSAGVTSGDCTAENTVFTSADGKRFLTRLQGYPYIPPYRGLLCKKFEITSSAPRCYANGDAYALSYVVPHGEIWCFDSSGFSGFVDEHIHTTSCQ